MKFTTPARRMLAAGAVSALAAGTLVGVTSTAAQAVPVTNQYTCQGTSEFPLTLESDIPLIGNFPSIGAGFDVEAGLLDVINTVTVPEAVVTTMAGFGITSLESPDFAGSIGATSVGVDGVVANVADGVDNGDTWSFAADGLNAAFEVPKAGTYNVKSPTAFSILAKNAEGTTVLPVSCELTTAGTNGTYSSLIVTKNESTSNATAVNSPVRKGDVAKVKAKVTGPVFQMPSGKVLLKKGTKTLTSGNLNDKGVVVLKTKALPVGKTKLKTVYKGDGYTKPSSDTVVFTVKR